MNDPLTGTTSPAPSGTLTVSELTRMVKRLIEDGIPVVSVAGELSNYTHHASGHRYFTLKDEHAQLRCVMFKWQAVKLDFRPEAGMMLQAVGNVTVYEPQGQYQMNVLRLIPAGRGDLLARLEEVKRTLEAEGVFANQRPIPRFPATVGVVTSTTGAAVRDIVNVMTRRAPHIRIVIRPTLVQGAQAPPDIVRALEDLNRYGALDVIVVARGGGSIEDMWCFNDERVARAIAASGIPVVSGVGHETDWTLADFAADHRAPTPSAAAELVAPDTAQLGVTLDAWRSSLAQRLLARAGEYGRRLDMVRRSLGADRFFQRLATRVQRVDELGTRLRTSLVLDLAGHEKRLERCAARLAAMNPRSVLDRGYALVFRARDDRLVTAAEQVATGDGIRIALAKGGLDADVTSAHE